MWTFVLWLAAVTLLYVGTTHLIAWISDRLGL